MSRVLSLYPRAWRDRYGDELNDLATERPLGIRGSVDLLLGAIDAHRHPELVDQTEGVEAIGRTSVVSARRRADLVVARRLGVGAILGTAVWMAGWMVAANGPEVVDSGGSYRDGSAGAPIVLLAVAMLFAGVVAHLIRLPRRARLARIGAFISILALPIWGLAPWNLAVGAAALAGLAMLAVGAWWRTAWGGGPALIVVSAAIAGAGLVLQTVIGPDGARAPNYDPLLMAISAFALIWPAVGATTLELPQARPDPTMPDIDRLRIEGGAAA